MIGWAIGSGLVVVWWLIAFAVITGAIMIRMEERELEARFGEQYRRYKSSVPVILPRFGKSSASAVP
jgi:protein-S-isoprenylcysteine O-methyltransferase Ste14